MILLCLGPTVPHYHLLSLNPMKHMLLLDSQAFLTSLVSHMAWPLVQYLSIPISSGDIFYARLLLPPEYDPTEITKKYPLLLHM